ncbi:hypothetical protein ACPPVQ_02030 [Diaminobutyricibacter sp. McL0618]|uniref:hypothetical protein n=1 Tax=Leifsonia sp. McL0618 TaxID=3415677 RepID=UPI003CE6A1A2
MTYTNEELAQRWLHALENVEEFRELCIPDARVWHSNDNIWVSLDLAIENVHKAGGLPPLENPRYTVTEKGFLVQFSIDLAGLRINDTIIVQTENGLAHTVEEYIGIETDLAAAIGAHAAAQAAAQA